MGKETSDFDRWLRTVETATENLGLVDSLNTVALVVGKDFGVSLWFVEIFGRRWSYLAGRMPEQCPQSNIERIELKRNIGLVSDSWEKLSEGDRTRLVEFLRRLVSERLIGCGT